MGLAETHVINPDKDKTLSFLEGQKFWQWMNGMSESTSLVVTTRPQRLNHSITYKNAPTPPPPPPEPRGVNSKGEAGDLRNLSHCHKGLSLVWSQRQRRCQCWRFLVFNRASSVWSRDKDWRSTLVCGPSQWRCKSVDVRRSSYSRRQWLTVQDIDSELFSPAAVGDSSRVLMW